jgi:hypothetical protein
MGAAARGPAPHLCVPRTASERNLLNGFYGEKKMPRGASPKREREYEELKEKFKESGRYKGREEEVASRIVNKQRAQYGETKGEKEKDREGKSPDRNLPIEDYQHLTIPQVRSKLQSLSKGELRKVESYEKKHKNRKGVLDAIDRRRAA